MIRNEKNQSILFLPEWGGSQTNGLAPSRFQYWVLRIGSYKQRDFDDDLFLSADGVLGSDYKINGAPLKLPETTT